MPKTAITVQTSQRPTKKARLGSGPSLKKSAKTSKHVEPLEPSPKPLKGKQKAESPEATVQKPRKPSMTDSSPSLSSTFKIVAGSYEKLLYGLQVSVSLAESPSTSKFVFDINPIFIFPAHVSCIKAVAASPAGGKWLATGSADEIIKVWDLRRRKEIGGLMHHQGSITHLTFPSRSHLLSASEDGSLSLFHTRDWTVLRNLKGHKGRVNSVAVHPSGKLALSVGKDATLRMWDLMRGKGSASTKLGKEGEIVRWNASGSLFAVQAQFTIDMYSTDMKHLHTITHPSRLHDIQFCNRVSDKGELLLVAAEDKKLSIYDTSSNVDQVPVVVAEMVGHSNRVKAVETLPIALPPSPSSPTSTTIVCTISSDGKIHIYDLACVPTAESSTEKVQIEPMGVYDTKGTRLTCLAVAEDDVRSANEIGVKRKRLEDDDDDQDSAWEEVKQ